MCPRNIHGGLTNPLLPLNEWALDDFIKILFQLLAFHLNLKDKSITNQIITKDHLCYKQFAT